MPKTLFFFTSSYPFGKGETFIENDVITSYSIHYTKLYDVEENIVVPIYRLFVLAIFILAITFYLYYSNTLL